jgi:hypothetical protein
MIAMKEDIAQEREWFRVRSLVYGGLIVLGVYMVQPFLTTTALDLSSRICVIAFSVAMPLLAALVIVDRQEAFLRRPTGSPLVAAAQLVAQWSAFVGVVAGFWHICWVAGVVVLASAVAGSAVISVGFIRLGRSQPPSS